MTAVSQASAGIEVPLLCNTGPKGLVLELLQGGAAPQKLVCREFPALIGRDESANVPLSGLWVGKQHAEIRLGGGGLMVVDRGTLSGTLVNDQRISEYGPLKLGDQIQIGSWTLRVDAFESPMVVDSSDEQAKIDRAVLKLRESTYAERIGRGPRMRSFAKNAVSFLRQSLQTSCRMPAP